MELAIVILNWNAADDTIRCLRRVMSWELLEKKVWVVDNNSADNSVSIIAEQFPDVHILRNAANLGFAGGTNQGIKASLASWDAPILLLNNDARIVEEDVLRLLGSLQKDQSVGLIAPLLFDTNAEGKLLSAGGKNPVLHHQTRILELAAGEPVRIVENVSGAAVIIRAQVFRDVGFLDEDFFFSTELPDLCMRANRLGYFSAVDSRARAFHSVSRSVDLRGTLYTYYIIRNRFLFIRNHYRPKLPLYGFWALYSLALALKLRLSGKRKTAQAVTLGMRDGLQGKFGGQNERVLAFGVDGK